MSDKVRRSITVEKEVNEMLSQERVNASGLLNDLARQHFSSGGSRELMLDLRIEQVESDIGELESRIESKKEELEHLKEEKKMISEQESAEIKEAIESVEKIVPEKRSVDNVAVKNKAEKVGLTPKQLLDRVEEYEG